MEDVQGGQEVVSQPALHAVFQENVPPHQAVADLAKAIVEQETGAQTPRDEKGKFAPKETKEEAKPAEDAKEAPAEEAKAEEATAEEVEEAPRKLKIKYNGEDREVDESEAVELAQKGYDYTQKMQKLAKEREESANKFKAEVEAKQKEYEQHLDTHRKALEKLAGFEDVDLNKLSQEDPVRAQQEFFKRVAFNQQLQQIQAEQQRTAQQRHTEMQAAIRKQAEASVEALQSKIPGWGNDLYGKVLKTAVKDYGFQQQEANAITDHRAIEVLHDAMKWRELQAAKPKTVDKRVAAVPKVQKPGTTEKSDSKASKVREMKAKLSKSGDRNDAAALFQEMIEQGKL